MAPLAVLASQKQLFTQHKKGILLTIFTVGFVGYLAVGAICFLVIEGPQMEKVHMDVLNAKAKIISKYPGMPAEALEDYMSELKSMGIRGIPAPNSTTKITFADAVFFSATLLTTIGYGHITPSTVLGKVVCMVYTACGIPLTLLLLAGYVERLMKVSEAYKGFLFHKLQHKLKPFYIRFAHIATILATIVVVCFIIPAFIYSHYEVGWSLFEGIYFCFISLTTVGLGDYVPALNSDQPHADLYKYGATLYIVGGITIMMFMMAMSADFHENYNCFYHETLPFTMPAEKIPIISARSHTESYGAILNENQKMIEENEKNNKIILP